jgi:hypothetical protein
MSTGGGGMEGATLTGEEAMVITIGDEKSVNAAIGIRGGQKPKLAGMLTGDGLIPTPT